ncbi:MAG: 50S ribosomal protein L29 [Candidatus Woesearchaeota archaeon]|nr:50S ribosomal protein L29 [Candidatus Woesearchaeota archaeon]
MKKKELRNQQPNELKKMLIELRKELMQENAQIAIGTLPKNPGKIRHAKRSIATILTLLHKKEVPVNE